MNRILYVPAESASPAATRALLALRVLLALFFLYLAAKNLLGDQAMAADFRRWGYSDGFRAFTGVLQIAGAALLLYAPVAFLGAALLACVLIGALLTHLKHDPASAAIPAAVTLALVAVVLVAFRPPLLR